MKKMNLLLLLIFCVLSCTVKIENPKILFDELNLKYSMRIKLLPDNLTKLWNTCFSFLQPKNQA